MRYFKAISILVDFRRVSWTWGSVQSSRNCVFSRKTFIDRFFWLYHFVETGSKMLFIKYGVGVIGTDNDLRIGISFLQILKSEFSKLLIGQVFAWLLLCFNLSWITLDFSKPSLTHFYNGRILGVVHNKFAFLLVLKIMLNYWRYCVFQITFELRITKNCICFLRW